MSISNDPLPRPRNGQSAAASGSNSAKQFVTAKSAHARKAQAATPIIRDPIPLRTQHYNPFLQPNFEASTFQSPPSPSSTFVPTDFFITPPTTPQESVNAPESYIRLSSPPPTLRNSVVERFLEQPLGTNLPCHIIAHNTAVQAQLDAAKVEWGVQYQLARGICSGLWSWDDVRKNLDRFTGTNEEVAPKIASIMNLEKGKGGVASDPNVWSVISPSHLWFSKLMCSMTGQNSIANKLPSSRTKAAC